MSGPGAAVAASTELPGKAQLLEIVNNLLEIFGDFTNKDLSNADCFKVVEDAKNSKTTVAKLYDNFLNTSNMLNSKESNKTYAIFYIYIRHIIFKLNYVKAQIEDDKTNMDLYSKAGNETFVDHIQKYVDQFNTKITDKNLHVDDQVYNSASGKVSTFDIFT
jgi:hypothetical protein